VELPSSSSGQCRSQAPPDRTTAERDRACVEGAAAAASALHASRLSKATADRGGGRGSRARGLSVGGDAGLLIHVQRGGRRLIAFASRSQRWNGVWSAARGASTREGVMRIALQEAISPCLECASSRRIQFLTAPAWRHADRRISAGLTVDATAGPRHSSSLLTTAQSYQRRSSAASEEEKSACGARAFRRSLVCCSVPLADC
jgi:hypothetical protein